MTDQRRWPSIMDFGEPEKVRLEATPGHRHSPPIPDETMPPSRPRQCYAARLGDKDVPLPEPVTLVVRGRLGYSGIFFRINGQSVSISKQRLWICLPPFVAFKEQPDGVWRVPDDLRGNNKFHQKVRRLRQQFVNAFPSFGHLLLLTSGDGYCWHRELRIQFDEGFFHLPDDYVNADLKKKLRQLYADAIVSSVSAADNGTLLPSSE